MTGSNPNTSTALRLLLLSVFLPVALLSWTSPNKPPAPTMSLTIGEDVALSSRRCAAARFLYHDVVKDPLAPHLAGEDIIASERINQKNNAVYPVVAIRTRWMDLQIEEAMSGGGGYEQLVLCGAGMDARAYRLPSLSQCHVFEMDVKPVLDYKTQKLQQLSSSFPLLSQSIHRVDTDFSDDGTWMSRLKQQGYRQDKKTILVLEGFLYYFPLQRAKEVLTHLAHNCPPGSLLLADHINDYTLTSLKSQSKDKWLTSTFSSSMDIPEQELPPLGFGDVEVVVVGESSANYGLWTLPVVDRQVGKGSDKDQQQVMRTYLIKATTT